MIESQEHRQRQGRRGYGTIEVGHASTRTGIVVQVDGCTSAQVLRHLVELAFDVAGDQHPLAVHDPGWWAVLLGWAGMRTTGAASIQRVLVPGELHAILVVEKSRMLEDHPLWPMLRVRPTSQWVDCRGETALRHGPADAELANYGEQVAHGMDVPTLRSMFDQGVIEWEAGIVSKGRRRLVPAGRS